MPEPRLQTDGHFSGRVVRVVQRFLSIFKDTRECLDPAQFDDPVALRTNWTPVVHGGNNFCTHRLQLKSGLTSSSVIFRTTPAMLAFCLLFLVGGVGVAAAMLVMSAGTAMAFSPGVLVPLAFAVGGGLMLKRARAHEASFERTSGQCRVRAKNYSIGEVHALQLLRETVRGNDSNYHSYELNLVFRDGSRSNVTDHGALSAIRRDASALADYLQIPVWDAIDFRLPEHLRNGGADPKLDLLRNNLGL